MQRNGFECSGALLESGGNDLHHILKHLRQSGQELSQGALQDRGSQPREGSLFRFQVGGRQAPKAQYALSFPHILILDRDLGFSSSFVSRMLFLFLICFQYIDLYCWFSGVIIIVDCFGFRVISVLFKVI